MKIAVPTRGTQVDDHFGHCEFYTVFTVDENKNIVSQQELAAPQGCGCKSGIAPVLHEMGVRVMLAGNMGEGAKNVLERNDISVIRGCSGQVRMVTERYLKGELTDNGRLCDHHDCGSHGK